MRVCLLVSLVVLVAPAPGKAAVVVIANYTDGEVAFQLTEPGAKAKAHKLPPNHVVPVFVAGPADLTFTASGKETKLRLDAYNAYVFLPDPDTGLKLEGLELPGEPLERDARADPNPVPRDPPVKVPVTLLVDDADPRAEKAWREQLRKRFDEASEVLEKGTGVKFVLAGFDTWKSDPDIKDVSDLLAEFEKAVKPKDGALAIGYTSRKINPQMNPQMTPPLGAGRGLSGRHILIREWVPKSEIERTEVLVHFLAKALGGAGSPDPGSALRPQLGNGYALHQKAVIRLDPLNALALNLWAEERRGAPGVTLNTITAANRARLTRVYQALLKATPGDSLAIEYIDALERAAAKNPGEAPKGAPRSPADAKVRDTVARAVIGAIHERAKANAAAGARALKGDALTTEFVKVAAESALRSPGPGAVPGFLVGLGVALDDTGALQDDAVTSNLVRGLETDAERKERLTVLGNPTLGGRRDQCRRFFLGGAVSALVADGAESVAVGRSVLELHGPANLSFLALASEVAGGVFGQAVLSDPDLLHRAAKSFAAAEYLPPMSGLRDGLSPEKFEELYGDTSDARFLAVLASIRTRVRELKVYK